MQKSSEIQITLDHVAHALIGGGLGVAVTLVLLYISAMLISRNTIGESIDDVIVISTALIGSILSGFVAATLQKRNFLLMGVCAAVSYLVIYLILSALIAGGLSYNEMTLRLIIASIAGGTAGGGLRSMSKQKKRSRRNR